MFDDIYGIDADELIDEQHRAQLASLSSPRARMRRAWRDPRGTLQTRLQPFPPFVSPWLFAMFAATTSGMAECSRSSIAR